MSVNARSQFDVVERFWAQLLAVDERRLAEARRRLRRRHRLRTLALAVLLLLVVAVIAWATKVFVFGTAAPHELPSPTSIGIGRIQPGTTRVLALRAADPAGGLPWGVRVFVTRRHRECFQVGRVASGRLVAVGIDGAFHNDGKAHPLPVETEACTGIGQGGVLRYTDVSSVETQSGLARAACVTPQRLEFLQREPSGIRRFIAAARRAHELAQVRLGLRRLRQALRARRSAASSCPSSDLRTVVLGAVLPGPSRVYIQTSDGEVATAPVDRMTGAFVFVLRGAQPAWVELRARFGGVTCALPTPLPQVRAHGRTSLCPRRRRKTTLREPFSGDVTVETQVYRLSGTGELIAPDRHPPMGRADSR